MNKGTVNSVFGILDVMSDLMRGGRHSRHTVVRGWGVSFTTADRWLEALESRVPGVRRVPVGRERWLQWVSVTGNRKEPRE